MLIRHFAAFLLVVLSTGDEARAQAYGALSLGPGQTLTFQQARARLPRLQDVIFEKADKNGDGVIDARELPTLEALYQAAYVNGR